MTAAADAPAYRLTVSVPPGALWEALGPGPVVDTDALVAETSTAALAHTGRPRHPARGRGDPDATPRMARLVRAQVDRMLAGEPPLNVVVRS